ncbi:MAG: thioredoxin family protein [Tatlockia sp.]|nr:thioredoxin family protein [Tatlockia sp.]
MSKTQSVMLALGTIAPQFSLFDVVSGKMLGLKRSAKDKATVIMFICNHCPYVKHVNKELTRLANDYLSKDVNFIAISSNDIHNYPDDSPENMKINAQKESYPFPYLFDETQEVAKAYQAACTPDFYVFDSNYELVYRGQLDDSRPGNNIALTGNSIREVLDCMLLNKSVDPIQKPSLGCNIKWK